MDQYITIKYNEDIAKANKHKHKAGGKNHISTLSPELEGESELNIPNYVIACIIGDHIIFMKEKWENWEFFPE